VTQQFTILLADAEKLSDYSAYCEDHEWKTTVLSLVPAPTLSKINPRKLLVVRRLVPKKVKNRKLKRLPFAAKMDAVMVIQDFRFR
jgi:hypothetical protein